MFFIVRTLLFIPVMVVLNGVGITFDTVAFYIVLGSLFLMQAVSQIEGALWWEIKNNPDEYQ